MTMKDLIIVNLFDSSEPMGTKEILKLNPTLKRASIPSVISIMRKEGLIEHRGYAKYVLTEKGKSQVSGALVALQESDGEGPKQREPKAFKYFPEMNAAPVPKEPETNPLQERLDTLSEEVSGLRSLVTEWERRYIELAKLAITTRHD